MFMVLVCAVVANTVVAAVEVEGFVEVGEIFRNNPKAKAPAVEMTVAETDGGKRFVFTCHGETPPPGDLFVPVKPLDGVTAAKECATTFRAKLWTERYPTNFDGRDVRVRRFARADGSALCAIQTGGNEKLSAKLGAENLVFVKRGENEWKAVVEFRKEIPYVLPTDPLEYPDSYSVEIERGGTGTDGYFPLGVLGESAGRGFNTFVGGNYYVGLGSAPGVYGVSCWAAIRSRGKKGTIRAENQDGKPTDACLFDPATRKIIFDTARDCVTNSIAKNDAQIFKWEIDNEYLPGFDYSPTAVKCFREWLPKWYKDDVEKFNRAWRTNGLAFADAVPPRQEEYLTKPGAWMDWTRFQQETFADFLVDYYKAFQDSDPKKRSVNGKDTQSSLEMPRIARYRRGIDDSRNADRYYRNAERFTRKLTAPVAYAGAGRDTRIRYLHSRSEARGRKRTERIHRYYKRRRDLRDRAANQLLRFDAGPAEHVRCDNAHRTRIRYAGELFQRRSDMARRKHAVRTARAQRIRRHTPIPEPRDKHRSVDKHRRKLLRYQVRRILLVDIAALQPRKLERYITPLLFSQLFRRFGGRYDRFGHGNILRASLRYRYAFELAVIGARFRGYVRAKSHDFPPIRFFLFCPDTAPATVEILSSPSASHTHFSA